MVAGCARAGLLGGAAGCGERAAGGVGAEFEGGAARGGVWGPRARSEDACAFSRATSCRSLSATAAAATRARRAPRGQGGDDCGVSFG
eukprot:9538745-Alexandrium_andersonii.AAC.1